MDRSVYWNLTVSGTTKDRKGKTTGKIGETDLTDEVDGDITYEDTDEQLRTLSFILKNGFLWSDVLTIGMQITLQAGTLEDIELLFVGNIKNIQPDYGEDGELHLTVTAFASEWRASALVPADRIYPSSNCPFTWGRTNSLTGKDLFINLAKECNFKIGQVNVVHDKKFTAIRNARQHKKTDFRFLCDLAKQLKIIFWFEFSNDGLTIYAEDETKRVNSVADHTFFYPARIGNEFQVELTSEKQIQLTKVNVHLDPKDNGTLTTAVDPKTGEETLAHEEYDGNEWKNWILDEAKLRALPQEEQNRLITLTGSGNATWEDVKPFFKPAIIKSTSSREPVSEQSNIVTIKGDPKKDGVSSTSTATPTSETEQEVDPQNNMSNYRINEKKLQALPDESRNGIMGRYFRGELSGDEAIQYFDYINPTKSKDTPVAEGESKNYGGETDIKKLARKVAHGFHITAEAYGDLSIKTKISYYVEGLGRYTNKYYLFKRVFTFGRSGFNMQLTFTK
jgi:hypothetical protein